MRLRELLKDLALSVPSELLPFTSQAEIPGLSQDWSLQFAIYA